MATLYYTATSCGAASYISAKIGGLFDKGVLTVCLQGSTRLVCFEEPKPVGSDRRTRSILAKESSPQRGRTLR